MKHFSTPELLIQMSARELEMVRNALMHYSFYWDQRAENTLRHEESLQLPYKQIAEEYEDMWKNVSNLLDSLPF